MSDSGFSAACLVVAEAEKLDTVIVPTKANVQPRTQVLSNIDPLSISLHFCLTWQHSLPPAGTRIIYDRKFLMQCRTSPLTRTPPKLPDIPGVTRPLEADEHSEQKPNNDPEPSLHREESTGTVSVSVSVM